MKRVTIVSAFLLLGASVAAQRPSDPLVPEEVPEPDYGAIPSPVGLPAGVKPDTPAAVAFDEYGTVIRAFGDRTFTRSHGGLPAVGLLPSGAVDPAPHTPPDPPRPLRIFFISDVHARHDVMARIVADANRVGPDLVIDGGDFVDDATETEFRRMGAERARLRPPLYSVRGNHDAEPRGPFALAPAPLPDLQVIEHDDVRFVLLDNHDGLIADELFRRLDAELAAHAGRRIVVVMHVPAFISRMPAQLRLRAALPFRSESPVMRVADQVARFTALMDRHGVLAVLSGHTHGFDHTTRGGVDYIVTGAAAGPTSGPHIPNEYLDLTIDGQEVIVRRIPTGAPAGNLFSHAVRAFRFTVDLNRRNHAEQGWNYVPSAGVHLTGALRVTSYRGARHMAFLGTASVEKSMGASGRLSAFGDLGVSAGQHELAGHLGVGYRVRPLGS
jgi:predicted phosphodiesterase